MASNPAHAARDHAAWVGGFVVEARPQDAQKRLELRGELVGGGHRGNRESLGQSQHSTENRVE